MKKIIYIGNYLSEHQRTPNFNIFLAAKLETLGYKVIKASSQKNQLLRLLDMWYTIIRERKGTTHVFIDVFSSRAFWFAWTCCKICLFLRIPYICLVRGGAIENRIRKSPEKCRYLFEHSHSNIAPSEHHVEVLKKNGFETVYIPNFLELDRYPFKKRKDILPHLFWVRSLHKIYQPMMAVRILERLLAVYPEARLTMVGPDKDGSLKELEGYIQKKGLQKHITFTGLLSKAEWHALSDSHDIFLNTTSIDNHPVSVIEAMALGLPIVSTNAGGLNKLLNHRINALLSDPDDEDLMLKHICELMAQPDLCEKLSLQGRKRVEEFDWKIIRDKYIQIL